MTYREFLPAPSKKLETIRIACASSKTSSDNANADVVSLVANLDTLANNDLPVWFFEVTGYLKHDKSAEIKAQNEEN